MNFKSLTYLIRTGCPLRHQVYNMSSNVSTCRMLEIPVEIRRMIFDLFTKNSRLRWIERSRFRIFDWEVPKPYMKSTITCLLLTCRQFYHEIALMDHCFIEPPRIWYGHRFRRKKCHLQYHYAKRFNRYVSANIQKMYLDLECYPRVQTRRAMVAPTSLRIIAVDFWGPDIIDVRPQKDVDVNSPLFDADFMPTPRGLRLVRKYFTFHASTTRGILNRWSLEGLIKACAGREIAFRVEFELGEQIFQSDTDGDDCAPRQSKITHYLTKLMYADPISGVLYCTDRKGHVREAGQVPQLYPLYP